MRGVGRAPREVTRTSSSGRWTRPRRHHPRSTWTRSSGSRTRGPDQLAHEADDRGGATHPGPPSTHQPSFERRSPCQTTTTRLWRTTEPIPDPDPQCHHRDQRVAGRGHRRGHQGTSIRDDEFTAGELAAFARVHGPQGIEDAPVVPALQLLDGRAVPLRHRSRGLTTGRVLRGASRARRTTSRRRRGGSTGSTRSAT